jgi:hypothetical protein
LTLLYQLTVRRMMVAVALLPAMLIQVPRLVQGPYGLLPVVIISVLILVEWDRWLGPSVSSGRRLAFQVAIILVCATLHTQIRRFDISEEHGDLWQMHYDLARWCRQKAGEEGQIERAWRQRAGERPELRAFCEREADRHALWAGAFRELATQRERRMDWWKRQRLFTSTVWEEARLHTEWSVQEIAIAEQSALRQVAADREFERRTEKSTRP